MCSYNSGLSLPGIREAPNAAHRKSDGSYLTVHGAKGPPATPPPGPHSKTFFWLANGAIRRDSDIRVKPPPPTTALGIFPRKMLHSIVN